VVINPKESLVSNLKRRNDKKLPLLCTHTFSHRHKFIHHHPSSIIIMSNPVNVDANKLAMEGWCPVSYHFGDPIKGDPTFSGEYEGAVYRFASKEGKGMFDANPAKFAPVYGGYCAFGMSMGGLVQVDPLNFKFVGDGDAKKLHVFKKTPEVDTKPMWEADESGVQAKADANWQGKSYKPM
jgi:YHS domain-containing protein